MGEFEHVFRDDLTDRQLAHFWDAACRAGRGGAFFYDRALPSTPGFVRWCRDGGCFPWIVLFRGEPAGMCALNGIKGRTAYGHFLLLPQKALRTAQGLPVQKALVRRMLAHWLYTPGIDGRPVLDRILGLTPAGNKAALHMVRLMGARLEGRVPGACYIFKDDENVDGILSCSDRETVQEECLDY